MRNQLSEMWQRFGLFVLNLIARSGGYERSTHRYAAGDRGCLDWYRVAGDRPTVIFLYGGNWRSGRRQDYRFVADTMCQMGVNVVIPDFPLYPGHRFGAILDGAVQAVDYFLDELDPDADVILMGHSSGAQKAALMTLDPSLLKKPGQISAMIGLSGPYDFFPYTEDDHWDLFAPEEHFPRSQPVNYVRDDAPELYLLHGEDDMRVRRGHSKSLMEKQQAAGGRASREVYPDMGHVDAVVSFSRIHRRKSQLIRDIQRFIESRNQIEKGVASAGH